MRTREETIQRAQTFAVPVLALAGALEILYLENYTPLLTVAVIVTAGVALIVLPPVKLFHLYFVYLMFEGALKLWTRYNPVVHVGSDVLLVLAFLRLWKHHGTVKNPTRPSPSSQRAVSIIIYFLVLFWLWVGIQFFNPWGLGLLPSLAGLKIYAVPMLTFLAVSFLLDEKEMLSLFRLIVFLGLFQAVIALVDWTIGPTLLIPLSPEYAAKATLLLRGGAYRPFGTTALPGGPSTWIFQALLSVLIMMYLVMKRSPHRPTNSTLWGTLLLAFIPLGLATLLVCQIRLILIRSIVVGLVALLLSGGKQAVVGTLSAIGLALYLAIWTPSMTVVSAKEKDQLGERIKQTIGRARSLESVDTWKGARGGTHAFEEIARRANMSIMGIGLSRVGAATAPWASRIEQEKAFGSQWNFADNVFLAIFSELGLAGLIAYLFLTGALIVQLFCRRTYFGHVCGVYCLVVLLSGYATEGILYQPEASFFWFYGAFGLRFGEGAEQP